MLISLLWAWTLSQFETECFRNLEWTLVQVAELLFLGHFWTRLVQATFFGADQSLGAIQILRDTFGTCDMWNILFSTF